MVRVSARSVPVPIYTAPVVAAGRLDQIAEKNDIKPTKEDIDSYAESYARRQLAQYGMIDADDEMVKSFAGRFMEDKNFSRQIIEQVANRKLFMCIRALVNVEEKTVSLDEFKAIANPEEK